MAQLINLEAIYVMWLREMKRFFRAKSRIAGSLAMPFFFLAFLGTGFMNVRFSGMPPGVNYIDFLAPGVIGMILLFASLTAGISVLWDREFGFLKEIMVTPVSRVSIVLGRILGGVSTALIQGILILLISLGMGSKIVGIFGALSSLAFMVLISAGFVGLGIAIASRMKDIHGFSLIMNFVIMPIFLLSGALFPLGGLPTWLITLAYIDPLTYGVDGLRGCLIGISHFNLFVDFLVLLCFCIVMVGIGAYLFEKTEVD